MLHTHHHTLMKHGEAKTEDFYREAGMRRLARVARGERRRQRRLPAFRFRTPMVSLTRIYRHLRDAAARKNDSASATSILEA